MTEITILGICLTAIAVLFFVEGYFRNKLHKGYMLLFTKQIDINETLSAQLNQQQAILDETRRIIIAQDQINKMLINYVARNLEESQ